MSSEGSDHWGYGFKAKHGGFLQVEELWVGKEMGQFFCVSTDFRFPGSNIQGHRAIDDLCYAI